MAEWRAEDCSLRSRPAGARKTNSNSPRTCHCTDNVGGPCDGVLPNLPIRIHTGVRQRVIHPDNDDFSSNSADDCAVDGHYHQQLCAISVWCDSRATSCCITSCVTCPWYCTGACNVSAHRRTKLSGCGIARIQCEWDCIKFRDQRLFAAAHANEWAGDGAELAGVTQQLEHDDEPDTTGCDASQELASNFFR